MIFRSHISISFEQSDKGALVALKVKGLKGDKIEHRLDGDVLTIKDEAQDHVLVATDDLERIFFESALVGKKNGDTVEFTQKPIPKVSKKAKED